MKTPIHSNILAVISVLLTVFVFGAAPVSAQDLPIVQSANPISALQGTFDLGVEIQGENFGRGAVVRFLVNCDKVAQEPKPDYCDAPAWGVSVGPAKAKGSTKLNVKIDVSDEAYVGPIDIEVELYGRKGKGTTLFSVEAKDSTQPNDCMFDFEGYFADAQGDGVYSDGLGPYVAGGGTGMRLDTNGSQKLERKNDTRFLTIDFSRSGYCSPEGVLPTDPSNPAGAAGFCLEEKGVDMRIEHQVQEPQGLCSIAPYNATSQPGDYSMLQSMGIQFEGGPVATPLLEEFILNGGGGSTEPNGIKLNYGCQGPRIDPDDYDLENRVLITRMDEYTWLFEGDSPCLTTQLGNIMRDQAGSPVTLYMPFALCIVDVNAPEGWFENNDPCSWGP
jgi:hypothetical protein